MNLSLLSKLLVFVFLLFAGCSKEPPQTAATATGPNNAVTRYGQNLAESERRAQETANKANAVIAQQQEQLNQAQSGNNP